MAVYLLVSLFQRRCFCLATDGGWTNTLDLESSCTSSLRLRFFGREGQKQIGQFNYTPEIVGTIQTTEGTPPTTTLTVLFQARTYRVRRKRMYRSIVIGPHQLLSFDLAGKGPRQIRRVSNIKFVLLFLLYFYCYGCLVFFSRARE